MEPARTDRIEPRRKRATSDCVRPWIILVLVVVLAACAPAEPLFADKGGGDGSTITFGLPGGSFVIHYAAADREPLLGCIFSVALMRQPDDDPLALGVLVAESAEIPLPSRGVTSGRVEVDGVDAGSYYLRLGGLCDWDIAVTKAGLL